MIKFTDILKKYYHKKIHKIMKIRIIYTFLKSLKINIHEKWYYKMYELFRYKIPKFIKNFWRFRKELWEFYPWDYRYNLSLFKRSLEITANNIEKYGNEIEESRMKKVAKMRRVIELLNNHIQDNFIEQAESSLGLKVNSNFNFEKCENKLGSYKIVNNCTNEEEKNNKLIYEKSVEIKEQQWKEIWEILKGQEKCPENVEWDNFFDGSGLNFWWD